MEESNRKKILLVLDMDYTILSQTTDYEVFKLLSEEKLKMAQQPCENWAHHMQKIYINLKEQNISIEEIKKTIQSIPLTDGFLEIFQFLKKNSEKFEIIIVSGANTLYIEWIIEMYDLGKLISSYYSNKAKPDDEFLIKISPNHYHECKLCENDKAQCKRQVLEEHFKIKNLDHMTYYSNIFYVGDGENDYCPGTLLSNHNHLFVREDYGLHKRIISNNKIECNIHLWNNGYKILETWKKLIN